MDSLLQDFRFAWRSLRKHAAFTAVAVATLALGIGANAAMFAVVNAVVFRPLPFANADRLVRVTADFAGLGSQDIGMSTPELYAYREQSDIFSDISGVYPIDANLTEVDEPERVEVVLVSPSYFSLLGVQPQLGRIFRYDEDDAPGIAEKVVLSDSLWRRRFGGRADAIGRKLRIDNDWYEVVGVMPPGFEHPGRSLRGGIDMWAPSGYRAAPFAPLEKSRGSYPLSGAIARLKDGVTLADARERLEAFGVAMRKRYPADYPERAGWRPRLVPLHDDVVGSARTPLVVILASVGVVLLIACANIAGLLLARSAGRYRELGIRRALGASRARIAALLLIESILLACAGGIAGLLLAVWTRDIILALAPEGLPRLGQVSFDARVWLFAGGLSGLTAVLFGAVPAWQFSKPDVLAALKDARAASLPARHTLRSALVVAEFALAMVLLTGAVLLVRSFLQVMSVDPGVDGRGVLTARLWLPQPNDPSQGRYFTHQARLPFFEEVLRRARELPGVEAAAVVQSIPLDGQRNFTTITIDGAPHDQSAEIPTVQGNIVSTDYFSLMRIPVRRGRAFGAGDTVPPVAVVNEEAARRYFPGEDPIGRRLHFGPARPDPRWMTIVGVVGNVLSENLEVGPRPTVYRTLTQASTLSMGLVIRASGDLKSLGVPLARAVRAVDPDQPTFAVRTMSDVEAAGTASRRFAIRLVGGFAALALLLAAIGIYGVLAYLVGQRTREIGIRMALGARRSEVVGMVIRRAISLAARGVAVGALAALVVGQIVAGMLFRVRPYDPVTFVVVATLLTVTAVLAAATPALRAAQVDPIAALRTD
jgi:putative ABC transport system permease protein